MFDLINRLNQDWVEVSVTTRENPDFKERVKYVSVFTYCGSYLRDEEIHSINYEVDDITQALDSIGSLFVDNSLKLTMKSGETLSGCFECLKMSDMPYVIGDIKSISYERRGVIYNITVKDK